MMIKYAVLLKGLSWIPKIGPQHTSAYLLACVWTANGVSSWVMFSRWQKPHNYYIMFCQSTTAGLSLWIMYVTINNDHLLTCNLCFKFDVSLTSGLRPGEECTHCWHGRDLWSQPIIDGKVSQTFSFSFPFLLPLTHKSGRRNFTEKKFFNFISTPDWQVSLWIKLSW